MDKVIKGLAEKLYEGVGCRMMADGWQTNGTYWWFEDTGGMSFRDAMYFWRTTSRKTKAKK